MKKVLVVNGSSYFKPFAFLGLDRTEDTNIVFEDPDSLSLVVFTGGSDISPGLYGHKNYKSSTNPNRDKQEKAIFDKALGEGIPLAGICRGSQFLCAMAGGKIIQDVTNHCVHLHKVKTIEGDEVDVSSTHHQMQYPWNLTAGKQFELLAWSPSPRSEHYLFDGVRIPVAEADDKMRLEPDVVWYSEIKALAAQFHPEYMNNDTPGVQFYQRMITKYLSPLIEERNDRKRARAS